VGEKFINFTLPESVLQIASAVFTLSSGLIDDFKQSNEDVQFILKNVFREFYRGLKSSASLFA